MVVAFYLFLGVVSFGLLMICVYFLLRKERKAESIVTPIN